MHGFWLTTGFFFFLTVGFAQSYTAQEIVEKSIVYHDPDNQWLQFKDTLFFRQELPGDLIGFRKVFLNNQDQVFHFWAKHEDGEIHYQVIRDMATVNWNNHKDIPEPIIKKYKLSPERAIMYRNYYLYLYGLPMKLLDHGAIIHDNWQKIDFKGNSCYKVKVSYLPEVGKDTWYFYFDLQSFALKAYQFYHVEEENDGEYILLQDVKLISGMKIPKSRSWYYNSNAKFLARDILLDRDE